MKQEIPKGAAIAIIAVLALLAIGFAIVKLNPPPAKSAAELGGGGTVQAGPGGLAPIGKDGKPVDESGSK